MRLRRNQPHPDQRGLPLLSKLVAALALVAYPSLAAALSEPPALFGIPVDFILFALTLLGVAVYHHYTFYVALAGLGTITLYKLGFTGFKTGDGIPGLIGHMQHEWVILTNLLCLLLGFALLSKHFEDSKVHIGYLAAIVAASNAGGSGSVVGDTTTTMMWIGGVSPLAVLHAYIAAAVALIVFGIPAALQQHKYSPLMKYEPGGAQVDWARVGIVAFILIAAIAVNVYVNVLHNDIADRFPFIGASVVFAILVSTPLRKPEWSLLPEATKGTIFLLSLVTAASMMPVEKLPVASWQTAMGLGFVSAVFDNIPLTALALKQSGYDWGMLAYTVGFGGSMIWFGSSAGVALSNMYPEAKNVGRWLYHGWHVTVAHVLGFFVLLAALGWEPTPKRGDPPLAPPAASAPKAAAPVPAPTVSMTGRQPAATPH